MIHNWQHSERVAHYARQITDDIGYKDKDFLDLCAYWHDAARTQGVVNGHEEAGAQMARKELLGHGTNAVTAWRAYEAIRHHKSTSHPTTIEGRIIRDADKLDIFTARRWQNCTKAG
ncbi:MAG TPA: HD domain-containing protein [Candidatus Saccharimonadaceae bacterium]|nr:HD domain-containing protein [Candidatus Saccharimonadaceae bacterium]